MTVNDDHQDSTETAVELEVELDVELSQPKSRTKWNDSEAVILLEVWSSPDIQRRFISLHSATVSGFWRKLVTLRSATSAA